MLFPDHSSSSHEDGGGGAVIVAIDRNAIARACTVAGFEGVNDLKVEAFESLTTVTEGCTPSMFLLNHDNRVDDVAGLTADLRLAGNQWPGVPILVVANPGKDEQLRASIEGGSSGFVSAESSADCLVAAARLVINGLSVFPSSHMIEMAYRATFDRPASAVTEQATGVSQFRPQIKGLTSRQSRVLELVAHGLSNKLIAQELGITESTVKVHVRSIMEHMAVHSRAQIIAKLLELNRL